MTPCHHYQVLWTLLTLLRQYRYLTTTNLMWNHCSPVFHFNWHYSVPRPLYNNLLLNYRYRQKTSWTYWTFALHRFTFSTTVNTTNSCMEQLWGRLFLLLSQKLWCNAWRNAPLQLADKDTALVTLHWRHLYRCSQRRNWRFSRPPKRTERRNPVY